MIRENDRPRSRRWRAAAMIPICAAVVLLAAEAGYRLVRGAATDDRDGEVQIFAVGGSTTAGEPFDQLGGFAGIVSAMYDGRVGDRPIRLQNLAVRGNSSWPQAVLLRQALLGASDWVGVVLIYSGHNDQVGRGPDASAAWAMVERNLLWPSQVATDIVWSIRSRLEKAPPHTMVQYEFNLRAMIRASLAAGLLPVLSTVVGNLVELDANCGDPQSIPAGPWLEARDLAERGDWPAALAVYEEIGRLLDDDPDTCRAAVEYQAARCLHQMGRFDEARARYWAAVEDDPRITFGRATPSQNAIIRRLAEEYDVPLLDAVALFERAAPNGMIGVELFADGHHPNVAGYRLLAAGFAEIIAERFGVAPTVRFADDAALVERLQVDAAGLARSWVGAGSWLLGVATEHPWPAVRFTAARSRFERALEYDRDNLSAWFGWSLSSAPNQAELLDDPDLVAALGEWRVYYSSDFQIPANAWPDLLGRLERAGAPPSGLTEIRRLTALPAPGSEP